MSRLIFLIFKLSDLLKLLKEQKRLFFSDSARYSNWDITVMSEIEEQEHSKSVKFKIDIHDIVT